ncbi:hypothetical protein [Hydrogenophaga palleronii]|uniref:hypothetical protein n=1 Tax=Hydrogenophaga palleronii TaxID=65655 RepID=UPI000A498AC1|nr:hypothetical protein [Hydrogenophaga palleronii]
MNHIQDAHFQAKSFCIQTKALRNTLDTLARCYREARPGDEVALMTGLAALISPARNGWQAEKLQSPQLQLQCLPL